MLTCGARSEFYMINQPQRTAVSTILVGIIVLAAIAGTAVTYLVLHNPSNAKPQQSLAVIEASESTNSSYGKSIYFLTVNASYSGSSIWSFDPSLFRLVTNDSALYSVNRTLGLASDLGQTTLSKGQRVIGLIAFETPKNAKPVKLEYRDTSKDLQLEVDGLPSISNWVSGVTDVQVHLVNPHGYQISVDTTILNGSLLHNAGERIQVRLSIIYFAFPGDPINSVRLASIANAEGFEVASVAPTLPYLLKASENPIVMTVILVTPPSGYWGTLSLTIQVPCGGSDCG